MAMATTIENIYDKEYHRESFNKSYAGGEIVKSKVIDRNKYSRYPIALAIKKCENLYIYMFRSILEFFPHTI
jgi:hypothetical protein